MQGDDSECEEGGASIFSEAAERQADEASTSGTLLPGLHKLCPTSMGQDLVLQEDTSGMEMREQVGPAHAIICLQCLLVSHPWQRSAERVCHASAHPHRFVSNAVGLDLGLQRWLATILGRCKLTTR